MSTSPEKTRDSAETEAATWLVLLSEDPGDRSLQARFEAWRAASPLHAEVWARTTRAYDLAGKAPSEHRDWRQAASPRLEPARSRRPRRRLVVAAAAALAACLLLLAVPSVLLRMEADYVTDTAELRTLTLDDGTLVRLGPQSALGVGFAPGERRVRLLKGEAFFEVMPDASRPFRVTTDDVVATVLGTAFEVGLAANGVGVAVRHGHVRVDSSRSAASESLHAGDWVSVDPNGAMTRGIRNAGEIGGWLRGSIVVRDRPVTEVVDALRRYHRGVILVPDSAFARTQVTGIYDLRDPEATLGSLASSHNAVLRRISPWLLIVTSK